MSLWQPLPLSEISVGGFKGLHEAMGAAARPLGVLSAMSNLLVIPAPALSTRPGLTLLGAAGTGKVNGLHVYRKLDGTTIQVLRHVGTILERYNEGTGAWVAAGTGLPDSPSTSANLNDILAIFTGSTAKQWNGTTLSNLTGAPQARYGTAAYTQFFVGGIPTREADVDFCDDETPTSWAPTPISNAGSMTSGAEPLTWIAHNKAEGKVLLWTRYSLAVLNGPDTPNRPGLWSFRTADNVGTSVGRTIQRVGGRYIWLADTNEERGFAFWSGGAVTVEHLPIKESLALVDWTGIATATAWTDPEGRYWCQAPKAGGGNLWFCWDQRQGWLTGTGPDIRAGALSTIGGREVLLVGDQTGKVYKVEGSDDAGSAIAWSFVLGPSMLGDTWNQKQLTRLDVVLSLETGATANAAIATTESGETWGATQTVTAGTVLTRKRLSFPYTKGDVLRLKLWGSGPVTVHDIRFTVGKGRW